MSEAMRATSVTRAPGHDNFRNGRRACFGFYSGFTLIELLVVIAIIAIIASILFPVFSTAKNSGKQARCASQLKQLLSAALAYSDDHDGRFVPAAQDIYLHNPSGGHWRWHGYRERSKTNFDPAKGPLWDYMARSGGLKKCPSAPELKDVGSYSGAFESGCGGFGYNQLYVGGTYYRNSMPDAARVASKTGDIAHASRTVMFADTAMGVSYKGSQMTIEYSFAEPPFTLITGSDGTPTLARTASPTVQFRHNGRANIGWCDGHVTCERMTFTNPGKNTYGCDSGSVGLGWFGPDDNSLFDNR